MDLIEQGFQESPILAALPKLEICEYGGEIDRGIQHFRCHREGKFWDLYTASYIRKEEEFVWKSFDEMLKQSTKFAAQLIQGFYGFELIALKLGESVKHFDLQAFQRLLVNHAKVLEPGQTRLIRFTSVFGILKKRINESFGKIEYSSPVTVYSKPAEEFDLFVKKLLKQTSQKESQVLLQDLSVDPIFRFGEENQTSRLGKTLETWMKKNPLPEIFLEDARGRIELGAQFGLRDHV